MTDLLWIDVETTGLDPAHDKLLEVAAVITDHDLVERAAYSWVVRPDVYPRLIDMSPEVIDMHGANGLLSDVVHGTAYDRRHVDDALANYLILPQWNPGSDGWILCGSSVHFDREVVQRNLPQVYGMLHYRMIDVSTLRVLSGLWLPEGADMFLKPVPAHRALPDIKDSIGALRYYRELLFRLSPDG